jgi:poly(3-hydroxybutyrate) depolymerase
MKWFAGLLVIPALAAQELRKGEVIDRVEVPGHPGQTYALYVPSGYTPDRVWPVLYCLDPGARGKAPVDRFAAAAEKAGVIVAGSNNSRNGPLAPSQEAINLMVGDTHARFAIDDSRIYAAGLSGGARLALGWAMGSHIAGVVASSAGFPTVAAPKQAPFRIYLTTGYDDFNHDELYHLSRDLARRNIAHRYVEFEGGHEWLPASRAGVTRLRPPCDGPTSSPWTTPGQGLAESGSNLR